MHACVGMNRCPWCWCMYSGESANIQYYNTNNRCKSYTILYLLYGQCYYNTINMYVYGRIAGLMTFVFDCYCCFAAYPETCTYLHYGSLMSRYSTLLCVDSCIDWAKPEEKIWLVFYKIDVKNSEYFQSLGKIFSAVCFVFGRFLCYNFF